MEHSEDEHHLDIVESLTQSKSSSPDVNNLVMGSKAWFAEVVGLQNWGIDPQKDVNHVYNKDLQLLFEDKVSHKGYSWKRCKSDKVKRRLEQLYLPLFQAWTMLKDGYVCESLTRAVVSEVLHFTSINWAKLGEEKWRAKSSQGEVILYKDNEEDVTFKSIVLEELESGFRIIDNAIDSLKNDFAEAATKVDEMRSTLENLAVAERGKVVQEELEKLHAKLGIEELKLDHSKRMIGVYGVDCSRALEHKTKLATSECLIQTIQQQIQELENLNQGENNDIAMALDNVGALEDTIVGLRAKKEVKMKHIQMIRRSGRRPITMNPSRIIGDTAESECTEVQIRVKLCSLCSKMFPKMDVILASCGCAYHPWCIITQAWISQSCANEDCLEDFKTAWLESMGLINMKGKFFHLQLTIIF